MSPGPEASNNDAVTILNDTPIAKALRQAREQAGLSEPLPEPDPGA